MGIFSILILDFDQVMGEANGGRGKEKREIRGWWAGGGGCKSMYVTNYRKANLNRLYPRIFGTFI